MKKVYKLVFLGLLFCIVGCSNGCPFIKRAQLIQPSADSEEKFKAISQWIPESINTILAIDVYKIARSDAWDAIIQSNTFNPLTYLKAPGLDFKSDIGMVAAFMEITSPTEIRGPAILIQGGFQQDLIVSRIRQEAESDKMSLSGERYKDVTIYSENQAGDSTPAGYAFAAIDDGLIAIASTDNLKWIIDNKHAPMRPAPASDAGWKYPIWGKMTVTDTLSSALPPPWNGISGIQLAADVAEDLSASLTLDLKVGAVAERLKRAIEGFVAIESLQRLNDLKFLTAIDKVIIKKGDKTLTVEIPEDLGLLHMISAKEEKADED